jgi:hypothetical protein
MGAVSEAGMMMNSMRPAMVPSSMQQPYPDVSMMQGPRSYSGTYGEGLHQLPVEADFSYALQRPGVVPGMDFSSSGAMLPQVAGLAFSPHHMPAAHRRSSSFSHSGGVLSQPRRRMRGAYAPNDLLSSPGNYGQRPFTHNNFMTSPTSIKEDSTDYVLGGLPGGDVVSGASVPRGGGTSSASSSLLTQQLEGRLAGQYTQQASSYQERRVSDSNLVIPPAYPGAHPGATMYPQNIGQPAIVDSSGGYYYTPYMTANGIMMAPVPTQLQAYGSYGSYPDQQMPVWYGQPHSLPQAYLSASLNQQSFEDTEQSGSGQRPHCPPPHSYNGDM